MSISIGSAYSSETGSNVYELYKQADNNMYREKLRRKQSVRSSIVQTLMKALETRDFITKGHAERLQNPDGGAGGKNRTYAAEDQ